MTERRLETKNERQPRSLNDRAEDLLHLSSTLTRRVRLLTENLRGEGGDEAEGLQKDSGALERLEWTWENLNRLGKYVEDLEALVGSRDHRPEPRLTAREARGA